jgi:hypothetical protein
MTSERALAAPQPVIPHSCVDLRHSMMEDQRSSQLNLEHDSTGRYFRAPKQMIRIIKVRGMFNASRAGNVQSGTFHDRSN